MQNLKQLNIGNHDILLWSPARKVEQDMQGIKIPWRKTYLLLTWEL